MKLRHSIPVLAVALMLGCGHDFEPPDRGERIAEATALFSGDMFDTISWVDDSVRSFEGNNVFVSKCRRCHGPLGRGETDYSRERNLQVPSLVDPDWEYGDLDSLRRTVFIGHEEGMPGYGVAGISPREIDASAYYLLHELRPEVLGGGDGGSR